jgi:hypothetical protein
VTYDEEVLALAANVPGLGGLYVDSAGILNVWLANPGRRDQIAPHIAAFVDAHEPNRQGARAAANMIVRQAAYDWPQLMRWHRTLLKNADLSTVLATDIDEMRNRIVLGVADVGAGSRVAGTLTAHGVPAEAVVVEVIEPERDMGTLGDYYTYLTSGIRIRNTLGACTLGFTVQAPDRISAYFITAAHCTPSFWAYDGQWFGQPQYWNEIGYEVADPPPFTAATNADCPSGGYDCRYSDAALIAIRGDLRYYDQGAMAFTPGFRDTNHISTGVLTQQYTYNPLATNLQVVRKTGATTGTSAGKLTAKCYTQRRVTASGVITNHYKLCQDRVAAGADGGDSGSPVSYGTRLDALVAIGILGSGNATQFTFSPWYLVERELAGAMGFPGLRVID